MNRRTDARTHRDDRARRLYCASVRLCVCLLLLSCTDPRARPVTPTIQLQLSPGLQVVSPGTLSHSVYAYDADGLGLVRVSIGTADSALSADSTRLPPEAFETTLTYAWSVPAGIPEGTTVRLIALVTDLTGFEAADTALFQVQPSAASRRSKRGRIRPS